MQSTPAKPIQRGDPYSAKLLRPVYELANQQSQVTVSGGSVARMPNGSVINPEAQRLPTRLYFGKIVDAGPAAEPDYTDERYWVRPQYISSGADTDSQVGLGSVAYDAADNDAWDKWHTVTNPAELPDHTHLLPVDGSAYVFYMPLLDRQDTRKRHMVMFSTGGLTDDVSVTLDVWDNGVELRKTIQLLHFVGGLLVKRDEAVESVIVDTGEECPPP